MSASRCEAKRQVRYPRRPAAPSTRAVPSRLRLAARSFLNWSPWASPAPASSAAIWPPAFVRMKSDRCSRRIVSAAVGAVGPLETFDKLWAVAGSIWALLTGRSLPHRQLGGLLCFTAKMPPATAAQSHSRRFRDVRDESGLPPTPDVLRQRSELTLRGLCG